MKNSYKTSSNTKAKIALFSVLGVLAVANYQGQPQSHQSQGETEFASLGVGAPSKNLEKVDQVSSLKDSDLRDEVNEDNADQVHLKRENRTTESLSAGDSTDLKASDKEYRDRR